MSLHTLAKHVQQKGRGKDQMLVHMTPREVQGLQALAKANGGSLTINPETGLAEAGFLEDILPIVAMGAATYFTAGAAAPALSAALSGTAAAGMGGAAAGALAGAGVGGIGAAIQGKDVAKGALFGGLGGAISGGMGAYDNALSANLVSGTGANEAAQTATAVNVANQGASGQAMLDQTIAQSGSPPPTGDFPGSASDPTAGMRQAAPGTPGAPGGPPTKGFLESYRPGVPTLSSEDKAKVETAKTIYQGFGPMGKTATLAAPGIAANIGMNEQTFENPVEDNSSRSTLSPDFQGYTPRQPKPYYQAQYTRYAASGGLMDAYQAGGPVERMSQMNTALNPQGGLYPQGMIDKTQYATPIQRPTSMEVLDAGAQRTFNNGGSAKEKKQRASLTADRTMAAMSADQAGLAMLNNARYGANMTGARPLRASRTLGDLPTPVGAARGGLADLGGYSDGGRMLKGPGDGMSDSIPGIIGRKQPARLADGEFVVPADVVSHLGNGSTDAGAKRLYAMMDKVRQKRTGKKKQAPAVNYKQGVPV